MSTEELIQEFLQVFQKDLIQMAIQYRLEHGVGVLMVNLVSGKEELDVEYYLYPDLPPDLQKRLDNNPQLNSTIYYLISLKNCSLVYEHNLDDNADKSETSVIANCSN